MATPPWQKQIGTPRKPGNREIPQGIEWYRIGRGFPPEPPRGAPSGRHEADPWTMQQTPPPGNRPAENARKGGARVINKKCRIADILC